MQRATLIAVFETSLQRGVDHISKPLNCLPISLDTDKLPTSADSGTKPAGPTPHTPPPPCARCWYIVGGAPPLRFTRPNSF